MFNNFYPYQGLFQPQAQIPAQTQNISYVNGAQAVEQAYLSPGSSAIYLDNNGKDMYIKQTDSNGVSTIKLYEYREKQKEKPKEYVTKDEFEKFKAGLKGGVKHESNIAENRKGE